ncbi:MAG: peptidoglycan-binding protein, partial [Patescibacteria group bacterium]|nr:peptidoglycan-binding protein [Patescibacteria group bacterium]
SINVFNRDLTLGSTGADVRSLQVWLNAHGYLVAAAGKPGSPGNETDLFGSATQAAIMSLQRDNDIKPAAGYFGPLTRAYVNNH